MPYRRSCFALPCLLALSALPCLGQSVPPAADSVSSATPASLVSAEKPAVVHVEGGILDESGGLLPGAKVHFASQAGSATDVAADATGSFRVDLPAGSYRVSAIESGYQQVEEPLELHAGAGARLVLTLKIEKNVESVTVTATNGYVTTLEGRASGGPIRVLDLPQSTHTVTHQLLEDRGVNS